MSTISFQQVKDSFTGAVSTDLIKYTDENGTVIFVPAGHRIWTKVYEPWLAAGNKPSAPG